MSNISSNLSELFDRIPRRHSVDNVVEINNIITEYEDTLIAIEGTNNYYEKNVSPFFDELEDIKIVVKKSSEKKHSKKVKDDFFDEASGLLKDTIKELITFYEDGNKMK